MRIAGHFGVFSLHSQIPGEEFPQADAGGGGFAEHSEGGGVVVHSRGGGGHAAPVAACRVEQHHGKAQHDGRRREHPAPTPVSDDGEGPSESGGACGESKHGTPATAPVEGARIEDGDGARQYPGTKPGVFEAAPGYECKVDGEWEAEKEVRRVDIGVHEGTIDPVLVHLLKHRFGDLDALCLHFQPVFPELLETPEVLMPAMEDRDESGDGEGCREPACGIRVVADAPADGQRKCGSAGKVPEPGRHFAFLFFQQLKAVVKTKDNSINLEKNIDQKKITLSMSFDVVNPIAYYQKYDEMIKELETNLSDFESHEIKESLNNNVIFSSISIKDLLITVKNL